MEETQQEGPDNVTAPVQHLRQLFAEKSERIETRQRSLYTEPKDSFLPSISFLHGNASVNGAGSDPLGKTTYEFSPPPDPELNPTDPVFSVVFDVVEDVFVFRPTNEFQSEFARDDKKAYFQSDLLSRAKENWWAAKERTRRAETIFASRGRDIINSVEALANLPVGMNHLMATSEFAGASGRVENQHVAMVTDVFLRELSWDPDIRTRREEAQEMVSQMLGVETETIKQSCSRNRHQSERSRQRYRHHLFDAALDKVESNWGPRSVTHFYHNNDKNPNTEDSTGEDRQIGNQSEHRNSREEQDFWLDTPVFEPLTGNDSESPPNTYADNLHFPDEIQGETPLAQRIDAALRSGDHLILTGPPGSGKSQLAEKICQHYRDDHYQITTATGDWTTFDTVGGYRPQRDGDELRFTPGLFLERFETDENGEAKNEWLVIDELNRANIDEAFGSLLTILTGGTVTLPFFVTEDDPDGEDAEENRVKVVGNPGETEPDLDHCYYVPDDWRLIATMNSVDKASLYRMSYAFMRRFSFVSVPVPTADVVEPDLLREYMNCWEIDPSDYDDDDSIGHEAYDDLGEKLRHDMALIWKVALQRDGNFGPGVIRDVLEHALTELETTDELGYDQAIAAHLLPQFEGQKDEKVRKLIDGVEDNSLEGLDDALPELEGPEDTTVSRQFAADHLGVDDVRDDSN